jgi:hypothetical protein
MDPLYLLLIALAGMHGWREPRGRRVPLQAPSGRYQPDHLHRAKSQVRRGMSWLHCAQTVPGAQACTGTAIAGR